LSQPAPEPQRITEIGTFSEYNALNHNIIINTNEFNQKIKGSSNNPPNISPIAKNPLVEMTSHNEAESYFVDPPSQAILTTVNSGLQPLAFKNKFSQINIIRDLDSNLTEIKPATRIVGEDSDFQSAIETFSRKHNEIDSILDQLGNQ
jgi:hypothetical protein